MIQFGNQVSFAENKTRRTWKPNVQVKSMYSESLQKMLRFRMTTHVMRCIKKAGGIDEYLVKTADSELKYPKAIDLKRDILTIRNELPEIVRPTQATDTAGGAQVGALSPSRPAAYRAHVAPLGLADAISSCLKGNGVLTRCR